MSLKWTGILMLLAHNGKTEALPVTSNHQKIKQSETQGI